MSTTLRLLLVLLMLTSASAAAQTPSEALARLAGTWEIVSEGGRTGCESGQTFLPTADGRYVDLSQPSDDGAFRLRYMVLQVQQNRVLMFIEGEDRLTAQGDPVLWWAVFDGADRFRWRRYDWPATATTDAEWRRCTT